MTDLEAVKALVAGAAEQFRKYERLHLAKGTSEGHEKATANAAWAERLEDTLPSLSSLVEEVERLRAVDAAARALFIDYGDGKPVVRVNGDYASLWLALSQGGK